MIICLMGPAGSGKSTLAKELERVRPERFARVPVDYFFVPRPATESMADYLARPFGYDWPAVDRALAATGPERSTPDCDFTAMRRRAPYGGLPIGPGPVAVLDGMRPHPRCDRLVLLELEPAEQCRRLVDRDRRWGTEVADRQDHLAATFRHGLAERPRDPDLRLSAAQPVDAMITTLLALLA
ncbi:hypothetical protein [Microlunatus parietis]|uniref:Energy-coupling factor transporter ATP-binding protein EcfA2 n=1 Tax=Microlunatus parietis TaxID=682979 RepID=A0A7Y9IFG9_9ACTN|nr:hypothetical protein [Microlunatus parietis]NYE75548.1 energy-coupling factor transporter ATP-binding protein EcfA2 [Microlunatus parietis]